MASLSEGLSFAAALKLASLAVHAAEHLDTFRVNPPAAQFDEASMRSLLEDPDVRDVLDDPANRALLPVRRSSLIEVALCDAKRGRLRCSLDADHEGRHEAGGPGGIVLASWARKGV